MKRTEPILIIGSHALQLRGVTLDRQPADWDYITTFDGLQMLTAKLRATGCRVDSIPLSENKTVLRVHGSGTVAGMHEVEIAWPGTAAEKLLELGSDFKSAMVGLPVNIATVDQLYTLKLSHRYLKNSPHFLKTMRDIHRMRAVGAKVFDQEWLKQREVETYVYKHPKLNVMKKDFFTGDGVEYVYDHDDIHITMAHLYTNPAPGVAGKVPAYEFYKEPGQQVKCSKQIFFAVQEDIRLYGVLEEALVLALERSQIPFKGKVDPRRSFEIALMKVCTSITSGWFREFAWENYDRVMSMFLDKELDYADRFWSAVDRGEVKKVQAAEASVV